MYEKCSYLEPVIGRNASMTPWIAVLLPLLLVQGGQALGLLSSPEYLKRHCAAHQTIYEPLIDGYLSQYKDGFTVADLLTLPSVYNGTRMQREFSGGMPLLYILDGELRVDSSLPMPGNKRLKNLEYFGMPVLEQLARRARLPDLALLYSPFDEPTGPPLPFHCFPSVRMKRHQSLEHSKTVSACCLGDSGGRSAFKWRSCCF